MGYPFEVDPKTGKKTPVDWVAREFPEIAELKARKEKLVTMRFPGMNVEALERGIRRNCRSPWRRVKTDYHAKDKRPPSVIRKEAMEKRKIAEAEMDRITTAQVHSIDAKARVDRQIDALAERGAPDTVRLFSSYEFSHSGEFIDNTSPQVDWPLMATATADFKTEVPVQNVMAVLCWADPDYWKKRLHALIDKMADDDNAVREADRPALLRQAKLDLLEAQRREEAANKMCEGEGQLVGRPDTWPWFVMLEVEPDSAPITTKDDEDEFDDE
jgi:hypothetical protein